MLNVPLRTYFGHGFYGSNDPTNSVKALKEVVVLTIRLQSHKVHYITVIQHIINTKCTYTKYTYTKNESKHSENPVRQNPIPNFYTLTTRQAGSTKAFHSNPYENF